MRIAVIMSTYNGERYLTEQIESILNQEGVELELFVRDDGSSDNTVDILNSYRVGKIHIYQGANEGYGRSYIDCLRLAEDFDYYSFSDQDDFWEKEKLKKAVDVLTEKVNGKDLPAVYYSNVKVSDAELNLIHKTELENRKQTLGSVSMRRSIAGCTMVFNRSLWKEIFRNQISEDLLLQGHDSFIISLCYALSGIVYCDKNAYICYRQHSCNTAGAPYDLKKRIKKEWKALPYDKQAEIRIARAILDGWGDGMATENKDVLELVASMGNDWLSKAHILFSKDFTTGDIRLTSVEKFKALIVQTVSGGVLKRIDHSDIISFDVFDTLISRDVYCVEMIYQLMERKLACKNDPTSRHFAIERQIAGHLAAKKHNGCATIRQIYVELSRRKGWLKEEEIDNLIHLEEEVEFALCTPKYEGRVLYEYCLWKRKKIVLISDMYLSSELILRMLKKCGYQNIDGDSIFVSSEWGSTKRSGKLFEKAVSRCRFGKSSWIHIGDAIRSDWLMSKRSGLCSIYIPSEVNHFHYKSIRNRYIINRRKNINYEEKNCTRLMNHRLPWIRDVYERFGYECLGSLIWGFSRWLTREIGENSGNRYDKIYFLAREGKLLKNAFDIVNGNNQSIYLPVSRKALNGATLWMLHGIEEKLKNIPFPDEFTIRHVEDHLGIELPGAVRNRASELRFTSWKDIMKCGEAMVWLTLHESDIDKYSRKQLELLMKLLNLDVSVRRIAIVDIGWKGTMQYNLELLLSKEYSDITVDGYYVGVSRNAGKMNPGQTMKGFLFHEIDENKVFAFSGLLEGIMTADHGSVKKYEIRDDGMVGCCYYPYEYQGDDRVPLIQNGAIRLCNDIQESLAGSGMICDSYLPSDTLPDMQENGEDIDNVKNEDGCSELWSAGRIVRFGYRPRVNDIRLFQDFPFFDGDGHTMNAAEKKTWQHFRCDFRRSKWKTAYLRQNARGIPFVSQIYVLARRIRNQAKW